MDTLARIETAGENYIIRRAVAEDVAAIDEAARRGCVLVQLTSDKRRVEAHRLYARLGFSVARGIQAPPPGISARPRLARLIARGVGDLAL